MPFDVIQRSLHDDFAPVHSRARPEIDDMIGPAHRLFIVLDNDERVPLRAQRRQRLEQPHIIARMQTDRRLIENVEDAAQIRTKLRRQPDALRFAAAQGFRRTSQREITEPDILHELEPLRDLRHEIVRHGFLVAAKTQLADQLQRFARGERGEIIDRLILQADMTRDRIQTGAVASRARHRFSLIDPFRFPLRRQFVFQDGIAGILRAGLLRAIPNLAEAAALLAGAVR